MKIVEGEYIPLIWDGRPDAHYIKGHISHDDGIEILFDEGAIDDETEVGHAQHIYARWSMEPHHVLRDYDEPGPRRFAVTMFGVGIFAEALKGQITMIDNIDWQVVTCAYGSEELPEDLKAILRKLDIVIKDANGLSFSPRESFGLKSTQVLSLVILLYKMGLLKGPKDDG